ncbi:MAG: tetratricopeptide repeat protein [Gemmatimonadota bacterium]
MAPSHDPSVPRERERPSRIDDLLERRLPQYLAVYLGGGWALIEFFAFLEDRFLLSPHWTNLILLTVVLLLPSVTLFVYFHGRKGPDRWNRVEKIVIPANLLVVAVVLASSFAGKDLGAMTTTVTVETEEGAEVERVVAKSEFRKSLLLFPLAADSSDPAVAWLGFATLSALATELAQDIFVDARPPMLYRDRLRDEGFEVSASVPQPLRRQIAQDLDVGYVVDGAVSRPDSVFRLALAVHDAERGGTLQERVYAGPDLLGLIDEASVQLRLDLGLPAGHVASTPDIPAREHTTASLEALQAYAEGIQAVMQRDDYETAAERLQRAVELDPTFAHASLDLFQVRLLSGDAAGAQTAIKGAMDHLYRLPERFQYAVKAEWYGFQQDYTRAFAVYEMWAELYPQDIEAQLAAAQVRLLQGNRPGAIDALERVVDLDPTRHDAVFQIGALHEEQGDADAARRYYERYRDTKPEDTRGYTALAGLERRAGNHDVARALYERALLLEPGDIDLRVAVAGLERDVGAFETARADYETALEQARSPEQRFRVLNGLATYYERRGALTRSIEYMEQAQVEADRFLPPLQGLQLRLLRLERYVRAGRTTEALEQLDTLSTRLAAPLNALVPIGEIAIHDAMEQPDALEQSLTDAQAMLDRTGLNMLEESVVHGRGRLLEMRGDCETAIESYERERELAPTDMTIPAAIGRCQREVGRLEEAEASLLATLRSIPAHGRTHYELALVYEAMGRPADAARHLESALAVWEPADEAFEWAARARERLPVVRREGG